MTLFRATLQKYAAFATRYWTNVYWVDAADIATASEILNDIMVAERPLYTGAVTITSGRVDDAIPGTDQYITSPFNLAGTRTNPTSSEMAPLWVTARVDFAVTGIGRPSRKYLRGVLWESDFSHSAVVAGMLTLLQTYANAIVALPMMDVDGQSFAGGFPYNAPQMRQLRRGKKRTVTP